MVFFGGHYEIISIGAARLVRGETIRSHSSGGPVEVRGTTVTVGDVEYDAADAFDAMVLAYNAIDDFEAAAIAFTGIGEAA